MKTMKKLSNKMLIIALVLLVAVFVLSRLLRAPGLDSNLRKILVQVDTAKVSEVRIRPSGYPDEEISLRRSGNHWKVVRAKQESEADEALVKSMIGMLVRVEPQRLVSRKKRSGMNSMWERRGRRFLFMRMQTGKQIWS